jgi:protein gp37
MSENTKIEWATHTFNPWEGCQKVGPGCDNCYAEARNARFAGGTAINWGPGAPRRRTSEANWRKPLAWNANHEAFFKEHGHRQRVFCSSLADVFDNAVDPQWLGDLFELIQRTPNLDWLLLTKRIGNWKSRMQAVLDSFGSRMPPTPRPRSVSDEEADSMNWVDAWLRNDVDPIPANVWIGATICNQEEADRDIPKLLAVPAAKRFLSMEPLLGPVDLMPMFEYRGDVHSDTGIDWLIVGGESGHNARPMHPDWALSLRDQCAEVNVPYLFKQWGEWVPHHAVAGGDEGGDLKRGHVRYLQGDGREPDGHFRKGDAAVARIGKKAAGRLLDGRTWDEVPA